MEFFYPCWIAVGLIYHTGTAPSKSYLKTQANGFMEKLSICNSVATEAVKKDVDPILAIAVAKSESNFTANIKSSAGAQGPMGVMPKFHCPKGTSKDCDLIQAGVSALDKVLNLYPQDRCKALAVYNRGLEGRCEDKRSEYAYALHVLRTYHTICEAASDYCKDC